MPIDVCAMQALAGSNVMGVRPLASQRPLGLRNANALRVTRIGGRQLVNKAQRRLDCRAQAVEVGASPAPVAHYHLGAPPDIRAGLPTRFDARLLRRTPSSIRVRWMASRAHWPACPLRACMCWALHWRRVWAALALPGRRPWRQVRIWAAGGSCRLAAARVAAVFTPHLL